MAQKSGHMGETSRFGWDLGDSSNLLNVSDMKCLLSYAFAGFVELNAKSYFYNVFLYLFAI